MDLHATYEENDLVALLKQRDQQAFKFLYDKYSPALYSVILQIARDKETANKVVQDTFMFIWRKMDGYDPAKERLFTWILKVARNAAITETYSTRKHQHAAKAGSARNEILPATDHYKTDECGLKKLINRLNEQNMKLIDLCYFKNLTDDQIAETLNIPVETVKMRIKIALSELRTMLT